MHILYMIFIYPLEFLMKTILEFSYSLTDNYGLSIIILSIIVNIMLLPLYYMAERWKAKDKAVQDSMKPEIDNIKKHYKGQERHFYIQTIYRRFGYHPLSSIKASVGFLIQIPFFFAAFHLLSNYQALNGVSFGILKDLGSPDHLIGGINVLPIVMTVVNLLSAYIYIELLNKSEKIQLFALAFIFLVVLYNEPAGLLLYWTMNNVFSLFKNVVEKKFKLGPLFSRTFRRNIEKNKPLVPAEYFKRIYEKLKVPIWFFILVAAIGMDRVYNFHFNKTNFMYAFESIMIFLYLDSLLLLKYFSSDDRKNRFFVAFIGSLCLATIVFLGDYVFHTFILTSPVHLKENVIILLIIVFLLFIFRELISCKKNKLLEGFNPKVDLFALTAISIFFLLFIVNPMILYLSAPDDFLISLDIILYKSFLLFLISLVIAMAIYFMSDKRLRTIFTIISINILLMFVLYSFIVVKDYGLMDHFIFNVPANLMTTQSEKYIELLLLMFTILVISFVSLRYKKIIKKVIVLIFVMLLSFFILNITKDTKKTKLDSSYKHELNTTLSLSKEKNIFVFFLDGFSGDDLERIFRKKKEVLSEYDGFIRYKNVLTVNTGTWGSVLAMFGGRKYTVEEINMRPNETLREKSKKAYNIFADAFLPKNWAVTYFNPQYAFDLNKCINNTKFDYGKYYLEKKNIAINKTELKKEELRKLWRISLFKGIPLFLKNKIYDNGKWGEKQKLVSKIPKKVYTKAYYWGFLNIFQDDMRFDNPKKTLNYYQLGIPHKPFVIDEEGTLFGKSSYFIECYKVVEKLGEIFHKMKANHIYSSSKIIIVSDHGWWKHNRNLKYDFRDMMPKGWENRMYGGMVNPILLVKDFNAKGKIQTSNRLMSNADVPAIVCSSLKTGCKINDVDPTTHDLNRTLIISNTSRPNWSTDNTFKVNNQYEVKNNIFDPKNWKKIK